MQEVENAGHDIDEQNNRAWQWRLKKGNWHGERFTVMYVYTVQK